MFDYLDMTTVEEKKMFFLKVFISTNVSSSSQTFSIQ